MSDLAMQAGEVQLPSDFLERYCRNHIRSFAASLFLSLFLAIALWDRVSSGPLLAWIAMVLLSQSAQAWYSRRFLQARDRCADWRRNWFPGFLAGSALTGLCWGSSFFLLGVAGFDPVAVLLIFSLAGVTAYAGIAKSHVFLLAFAFELGVLLPMAAWLFMLDGTLPRIMGLIALLYLGVMYILLRQVSAMTRRVTSLHEENSGLSEALRKVRALEREGAMFRSMFETIADPAVAVHDPRDDNRIIYANDAACRHFGTDRETLLTWRPADFDTRITPEKGLVLQEALQKRGRFAFQSAHRRADGEEVPVEVVINMFRYKKTELMVTFIRNISARLAADDRMRELELAAVRQEGDQRIGRYLECVPGLFFTLRRDRDGVISMPFAHGSSPSFQGLTPEVVADSIEPLLALCHPDDIDPLLSELHASALERRRCRAEFRIGSMSQRQMTMELTAQPQPSPSEPGVMEWHGFMQDITARKQLEEQSRMKGYALDHSSEALYLIGAQGRFVYVNEQACRSLGYSREELLTMGVPDIDPDYAPVLSDRSEALRNAGGSLVFETCHKRRDGSLIPVEIQMSELEYGGQVLGLSLVRDITERKKAETALAAREQAFRSLAESSPDAIVRYDREGRICYLNQRLASQLGLSSMDDAVGKRPGEVWPDERFSKLEEAAARVAASGERAELEMAEPDGKGGWWYHLICVVPEQDAHGNMIGTIAFGRNVTERKRMEMALAEREAEFRSLSENSPDAIFRYDRDGIRLFVNQTVERLTGKSRESLVGKSLVEAELNPSIDAVRAHQLLMEVIQTGERRDFETTFSAANGQRVTFHQVFVPEFAADGSVQGALGIGRDITGIKQVESELQRRYDEVAKLNDRLEENARLLEEQTVEMEAAQDQLKQTEAWYRGVLHSAPDGMMVLDERGHITQVNAELARMFGYEEGELSGRAMEVLVPADMRVAHVGIREKFSKGQNPRRASKLGSNLRASRKDGSEFFVDVTLSYLPENEYISGAICAAVRDVTERRQAEQVLDETRQRLHSVVRTIPDMVWMKDVEGVYLSCNHAFERFFGAEEAAIVGKTDYDFVEAGLADFFRQKDREAIEVKAVRVNEEWVTFADNGRRALLETRKVPVFDANGNVTGVLGVARDITERNRMEEELRKREREFRMLVDSLPDPFFRYDREHRRTYVNAQVERLTGKPAASLLGLTVTESKLAAPHWNAVLDNEIGRVLESGQPSTTALEYLAPDGQTRYFDCWLGPVFGSDGMTDSVMLIMRDITERKLFELKLAEREREFRTLVENVNDVIVRYDRDCRRTYVNPAWVRVNGISAEEAVGRSPRELGGRVKPMSREFEAMLREVMEKQCSSGMDLVWEDESGRQVCFQLEAVPEFNGAGEVAGALTVARDISERKRMEAALALREQEFRTLVENAADTVARYGKDMRRLYANPAFAKLVEGGLDALLGKKPSEVPGGSHMEVYEAKLAEVLTRGQEVEFELEWHDKAGHMVCSLVSLTPEFGKDGTVESALAVGRDISELNAFRQKIHQMAFYDTLTSLPNRALFNDRLRQMLTDASWHGQLAGVMMLDMDRFKAVNDTMGHAVGDELLRETGARLSACVRSYDTVARLGGDEFAVLLPDVRNAEDLGRVADKLRTAFDLPFMLEGKEVFISCSIGIALYPNDSDAADDLVKYADSAMYLAKRSGRNNFRFYSKDLTDIANSRLMLESDLRRAVERNELELYYQPKVVLDSGMIAGSEALLRWHHPRLGMVPPNQFIEIAEDSGLIVELGAWVLREACKTASEWNGPGKPVHKVAINLSARQFQTCALVATVYQVLEETGCYPEWIELEITESLLLDEDGRVLEMLNAFRSMGITIAIDDFGTGYSALSYLARFPIDTLKIDRSFIRSVTEESYRAELVKAILSIAHCLGQQVVAEGVETVEQAAFLQAHGCRVVQGFLYSKPLPKNEIAAMPRSFYSVSAKVEGVSANA